jgi:glycosyltransferase involved in cell wall biosynthesis
MVAGLPVIVSDHVGAKEIVDDGVNGFIFPSGDSLELAKNLSFFYDNPEKSYEFGEISSKIGQKMDYSNQGKLLKEKIRTFL